MKPGTTALALLVLPFLAGTACAQAAKAALPANTIDCRDWTRNADGSWKPHDNAKAFDLGHCKGETIQGDAIGPHDDTICGIDLWTVVDGKCGAKP